MVATAGEHVQPVDCVRQPDLSGALSQVAWLTNRHHRRPPELSNRIRATMPTMTRRNPLLVLRPGEVKTTPRRSIAKTQATLATPPICQRASLTGPRKAVK